MATSYSGPAPVTARTVEDCPEYDDKPGSGCKACRRGRSNDCIHPYRQGKTRRDRRNLKIRIKNIPEII